MYSGMVMAITVRFPGSAHIIQWVETGLIRPPPCLDASGQAGSPNRTITTDPRVGSTNH
jgi:hypothetical protein